MDKGTTTAPSSNNDAAVPPPSYAPVEGIQPAPTPALSEQANPNEIPFKPYVDGTSMPVLNSNNDDVESGPRKKISKAVSTIFCCGNVYTFTKHRMGTSIAVIAFVGTLLLILGAVGGIIFGFTVATERGLTGEDFWSPNHNALFRICESDSTSAKPFQLHTCNVFRPNYDLEAAPLHSFVESVRSWSTGTGSKLQGQARRIDAVRLDALLLTYGLKCSVPNGVTPPPTGDKGQDVQLLIGGVGAGFDRKKHGTACNYWQDGSLKQDSCARYNDGGVRAIGKTHPLGINAIMRKHFSMTCEWVD